MKWILKTGEKMKNTEEINLIADFELEYGQTDYWSEEVQEKFDKLWKEIQNKYD